MKKRLYIGKYLLSAGIVLLLSAGIVFWYIFEEKREENKVLKVVNTLAEDVSKNSTENPAAALLKLKSVADAFDYPAGISFGKNFSAEYEREALLSALTRYRATLQRINLTLSDQSVEISENTAVVQFSLQYALEDKAASFRRTDVCDGSCLLVKKDGLWKIKNLQFSKILQ